MEVLASRVLLLSADPERLQSFYRERLGLPVHREYPGGVVFFAGNGLIEISSHMKTGEPAPSSDSVLWLQVRDAEAVADEFRDRGVPVTREPRTEPCPEPLGLGRQRVPQPLGELGLRVLAAVGPSAPHDVAVDHAHVVERVSPCDAPGLGEVGRPQAATHLAVPDDRGVTSAIGSRQPPLGHG